MAQMDKALKAISDKIAEDMAASPEDSYYRAVMGDFLRDNNFEEEADAMDWSAGKVRDWHGRIDESDPKPQRVTYIRPYTDQDVKGQWVWFDGPKLLGRVDLYDPQSNLPTPVYEQMTCKDKVANYRKYDSPEKAEEDFVQAFVKARRQGWDPRSAEIFPKRHAYTPQREPYVPDRSGVLAPLGQVLEQIQEEHPDATVRAVVVQADHGSPP